MQKVPRINVLGVGVSALNMEMALEIIEGWIERRGAPLCLRHRRPRRDGSQRDENLRRIHNRAGLVTPDGMPLVWLSRLKGFRHVERVYGPDLMLALCGRSAAKGYRHFFYGGAQGVPEQLAARLRGTVSGLAGGGDLFSSFPSSHSGGR